MFGTSLMAQTCTARRAAAHPQWDDGTPPGSDYPVWNEFTLQGDHEPNAVFYNLRVSCINARMLNRVSGFLVSQNSKLISSEGSA